MLFVLQPLYRRSASSNDQTANGPNAHDMTSRANSSQKPVPHHTSRMPEPASSGGIQPTLPLRRPTDHDRNTTLVHSNTVYLVPDEEEPSSSSPPRPGDHDITLVDNDLYDDSRGGDEPDTHATANEKNSEPETSAPANCNVSTTPESTDNGGNQPTLPPPRPTDYDTTLEKDPYETVV